jgi:hypothetical protein
MAIATEALYALARDIAQGKPVEEVEDLVREALKAYHPAEGARSLYRAVSNQLVNGR